MGINNQFVDAEEGLSREQYNRWIKDARKRYLGKFPTNSLLFGDNHYKYDSRKGFYCESDLSEPLIGNLNASQIAAILDTMDVYTIMSLICGDTLSLKYYPDSDIMTLLPRINGNYVDSNGISRSVYSLPFEINNRKDSISRYKKYHTKQIYFDDITFFRRFDGSISANEALFRFLRLPVSYVLGSINEVSTQYNCNLPYDEKLCDTISEIIREKPKEFKKIRR